WSLGDFQNSIKKVAAATELYLEVREFDLYFRGQSLILRMYLEMNQGKLAQQIRDDIESILKKEKMDAPAVILTMYAFIAHNHGELGKALEYLQKALAVSLANGNKEDTCYAIYGLVVVYAALNRLDDALNEIYNLKV